MGTLRRGGKEQCMTPAPCLSSLYECTVLHERFAPRRHRFAYRLFYFALDLDELPSLPRRLALFSLTRPNCFRFREGDFLPLAEPLHNPSTPPGPRYAAADLPTLKSRVRAFCAAHGADLGPQGRVLLITLPRVLGFQFNPVSFYFCLNSSGTPVGAIAEVTNTFHEVKPYFIPPAAAECGSGVFRLRTPKHFYVSPFSGLDLEFDFTLHTPGRRLGVRIDARDPAGRVLHTALTGRRAPLTDARLAWFLVKYPLVTVGIVARIHWQALRLWAKRVPFFPKAARPASQQDLYRPHPSIARTPSA
jgi:DUF1365 family protein